MEGSAELNESMENSAETPHLKRKENDQLHSQTDCIAFQIQNPAPVISEETGWTEHLSSLRSPEMLLETLAGKGSHHDLGRHCVSEPPASSCPSNYPGTVMEKLTLRNVNSPKVLYTSGVPGSVEDSPIRKGLWHNLTRIVGGSRTDSVPNEFLRVGDGGKGVGSFMPQSMVKRNLQFTQLNLNHLKTPNNVVEGDSKDFSKSDIARHPTVNSTKVLSASGFRQFLMKSTLKGKGIAYSQQRTDNDSGPFTQSQDNVGIDDHKMKASESSHKPIAKADEMALLGGSVECVDSNVQHDGTTLRDWLKQNHRMSSKFERLQIFKQILKLVDASHSQGHALQHLKPSHFVVPSSGFVKYIGSINAKVQAGSWLFSINHQDIGLETHLKRKRSMEYDTKLQDSLSHKQLKLGCDQELQGTLSRKHQRLRGKNQTVVQLQKYPSRTADLQGSLAEEVYDGDIRTASFDEEFSEQIHLVDLYKSSKIPARKNIFDFSFQEPASGILSLEDRWYASPEKLNANSCPLSSNIYSLGVLFFELFCSFETEEVHLAAMSNLRHRILPPSFLSECPKEAGFCLWLLHPDPSARPKSREISSSNLIFECNNVSAIDQLSVSIDEEDAEAYLLLQFLSSLKDQNENQAAKLVADIHCLETDIAEVERRYLSGVESISNANGLPASSRDNSDVSIQIGTMLSWSVSNVNEERLMKNIEQLKHAYFYMRSNVKLSETNVATRSDIGVLRIRDNFSQFQDAAGIKEESTDCLGSFFEGLCKYARYSKFEVRGSIRNVDILNSANVICSLSFDRDEEYFAAAGVSKKIKIFEFGALLNEAFDVHYPLIEMSSRSKLSCVSWNNYIKNYLASTDYDGVVQLWDANTGQGFTQYAEHEKRAWSVDFSSVDPTKLASGSDDCSVKLWSIKERNCIATIRNVANVCCVQFSPHSSHLLTFGSADNKIFCYDLRNTRGPWCTLSGHGKAVSYVKFVDSDTLVSASTDNTLKLWDLNKSSTSGLSSNACSLTFTGHTNEKNFVGLTVLDGFIACGSETNEVYAYHKALPMPITSHKFGSIDPITGQETGDDNGQFVSSVCWRTKSNMIVVANSSGSLKLLQLV
ncbi:protein SUPPRESSOR OF PHYA-105 1 [Dendrobium catenatum]|uniref:Protein SUPPRESSOR OF PHYA-105 1 n=1 Tax=Dendrobium catenatum TaxID=906689 RepID=A0A2I0VFQ7_9ASPA|nr:protein SUPPRESSOR OF PHYA-105 1 [Dendrobium catenatum]XP_028547556.1 protein SUPPRESSOR OF PHYA-105 1 [Dendrobium catenatum]PKU62258.1 Protein SUPPRESSOR OF PHYA-105 1 [Dendrobium catenatum]